MWFNFYYRQVGSFLLCFSLRSFYSAQIRNSRTLEEMHLCLASSHLIVMPKANSKSCGDCIPCKRGLDQRCGFCKPCVKPELKRKCEYRVCIRKSPKKSTLDTTKIPFVPEAPKNLIRCIVKQRVIAEVNDICEAVLGSEPNSGPTKRMVLQNATGVSRVDLHAQLEKIKKVFRKRSQFLYLSRLPQKNS